MAGMQRAPGWPELGREGAFAYCATVGGATMVVKERHAPEAAWKVAVAGARQERAAPGPDSCAGSWVASQGLVRPGHRNFFYPQDRWRYPGMHLAGGL